DRLASLKDINIIQDLGMIDSLDLRSARDDSRCDDDFIEMLCLQLFGGRSFPQIDCHLELVEHYLEVAKQFIELAFSRHLPCQIYLTTQARSGFVEGNLMPTLGGTNC